MERSEHAGIPRVDHEGVTLRRNNTTSLLWFSIIFGKLAHIASPPPALESKPVQSDRHSARRWFFLRVSLTLTSPLFSFSYILQLMLTFKEVRTQHQHIFQSIRKIETKNYTSRRMICKGAGLPGHQLISETSKHSCNCQSFTLINTDWIICWEKTLTVCLAYFCERLLKPVALKVSASES